MSKINLLMRDMNTDAALITSSVNRRYYTGFPSSAGVLVVTREQSVLVIDSRYYEAASKRAKVSRVILQDKIYEQVADILSKNGAKTVSVEAGAVTLSIFSTWQEKLRSIDASIELVSDGSLTDLIADHRVSKTEDELSCMREAQRIADKTFDYITGYIKPGMKERDIALEIEFFYRREGADGASFNSIVAGGANSSMPHAVPGHYEIQRGDMLTLDFGCVIGGYCSDMTRTVAIGQPGGKQVEVYNIVLKAQRAALDAIRAGVICEDIDKIARDIIDSTQYKGLFGHSLGHSIGLEIHEPPRFMKDVTKILPENGVMSVEPGIYIPGEFGVRIEDVVRATKDGCENLAKSPKELIII